MNRRSLYAAFGDKHTLYLKAPGRYWEFGLVTIASAALHTIAISARAGIPGTELREIACNAVSVICG